MKKTLLIALVTGIGIFGFTGLKDRVLVWIAEARETVNENTSTDTLVKIQQRQLQHSREKLAAAEVTVARFREKAERSAEDITRLTELAATGRARLERLRPVLAGNTPATPCGSVFVMNGCRYTSSEVEAAARELIQNVKQADSEAALKQSQLKDTRKAIASGESALTRARTEMDKAIVRHREIKLRFETETARAQTSEVLAELNGDLSAELNGSLASTSSELEKRLAVLKQQNDDLTGSSSAIAREESAGRNTLQSVNDLLKPSDSE